MDIDDDTLDESIETGSDELLADDQLRLPDSANMLVRLHAVRAWLSRRIEEASSEIGVAALALQRAMYQEPQEVRPRRRERQNQEEQLFRIQHQLAEAQQRLNAYEEAQTLLEDCVAHTNGERVLVEYYLSLDELVQDNTPEHQALADVQRRIEHVCVPGEEDM